MLTFSEYINEGIVGNIAKKVIVGTIATKVAEKAAKKVKEFIKGDASERFVSALEKVNATLIHGFRDNNTDAVYFVKCKAPQIGELVAQVSKALKKANPFEGADFTFYGTIKTKNGETLKPGTPAYFGAMIHHPKDKFDVEEIAHYKDK